MLLAHQIVLRGILDGHVARVDAEPGVLALGGHVVVRCPRIPDEQITGLGADLDPFAPFVGQPLHAGVGEAIPLRVPGWDGFFPGHLPVELLAEDVGTFADNQAAVVRAVGEHVDQALHDPESRLARVLVLVRPGLVGWEIGAVREAEVDGVEGDDQVFVVVDLLEGGHDRRLGAHFPHEVLVCDSVVETHALLVDDGQLVLGDGGLVGAVEAELEVFQVGEHVVGVLADPLGGDGAFDHGEAIAGHVSLPISDFLVYCCEGQDVVDDDTCLGLCLSHITRLDLVV